MGTRADFYVRMPGGLKWHGSVSYDGGDVAYDEDGPAAAVRKATTADEFTAALDAYYHSAHGVRLASKGDGWPWPWNNSLTTDYAYVFDGDRVRIFNGAEDEHENKADFEWPDMSKIANVTDGGFMILSVPASD